MPAINQKLTLWAGDSLELKITARDQSGALVNLATPGCSLRWWVSFGSPAAVGAAVKIKKTIGAGITVVGTLATVTLMPADTDTLTPGTTYFHEAELITPDGKISTLITGPVTIVGTMVR